MGSKFYWLPRNRNLFLHSSGKILYELRHQEMQGRRRTYTVAINSVHGYSAAGTNRRLLRKAVGSRPKHMATGTTWHAKSRRSLRI